MRRMRDRGDKHGRRLGRRSVCSQLPGRGWKKLPGGAVRPLGALRRRQPEQELEPGQRGGRPVVAVGLPVVGGAVVVHLAVGRGRGAVLLGRSPETDLGGGGRDAGAEEAVLIAAHGRGLLRVGVRARA